MLTYTEIDEYHKMLYNTSRCVLCSFTNICTKALFVYFIFQYDVKEDIIMWASHSFMTISYHEISEKKLQLSSKPNIKN